MKPFGDGVAPVCGPCRLSTSITLAYTSAVTRALEGQQSAKAALEQAQKEAQRAIDAAAG